MEILKKAQSKLNEKQLEYCKGKSSSIKSARKQGDEELYAKMSGKLRGYLESLWDMNILEEIEMKALYLHFK